jgi:hypothetical protein
MNYSISQKKKTKTKKQNVTCQQGFGFKEPPGGCVLGRGEGAMAKTH